MSVSFACHTSMPQVTCNAMRKNVSDGGAAIIVVLVDRCFCPFCHRQCEVVPPLITFMNFTNIASMLTIVTLLSVGCGWLWLVLGFSLS